MRKQFKVKQFYSVLVHEDCGGYFDESNNMTYTTYPAMRDYRCSKCGTVKCLSEKDWPGMETEIVGYK